MRNTKCNIISGMCNHIIIIISISGHTRQGLKCRICKMNVHFDCQEKVSKCQTKARLLRRQKSTSEIETKTSEVIVEDESKQIKINKTIIHYTTV